MFESNHGSHKIRNFCFVIVFRPRPSYSHAQGNIPSHRDGGADHLPGGSPAAAASCGLDKGWRTSGPLFGMNTRMTLIFFKNSALLLIFCDLVHVKVDIRGITKSE